MKSVKGLQKELIDLNGKPFPTENDIRKVGELIGLLLKVSRDSKDPQRDSHLGDKLRFDKKDTMDFEDQDFTRMKEAIDKSGESVSNKAQMLDVLDTAIEKKDSPSETGTKPN